MVALPVLPAVSVAQAIDGLGKSAERHVVILNATDPYLPAFLALDSALREAVRAGSRAPAEYFAEALREKYRDLQVDVIVAVAKIALDFAQRHRDEIWPGAVIVFNSVTANSLRDLSLEPRTIGVPVRLELVQTLDLALKLRPEAQRIAVVAGAGGSCCGSLEMDRGSLEQHAGGRDVQYLVGLPLAETVAAVRALPEDAVVLYLAMFRDGDGVPHVPRDVLSRISAVSRAPVFGVFETYLGHGIAAGSITSFKAQGRRAGELVARVLNGEDPAAIGVQAPLTSGCIADWRQLRHWNIDEDLL
jgi:ABC-type uncharacterized transport system substrate-binding protein